MEEILEKAIQKAIDGGWKPPYKRFQVNDDSISELLELDGETFPNPEEWVDYQVFIFNHDFARALWGEKQGFNGVPVEAVLKMAVPASKGLSDAMHTVSSIFSMKSEPVWQYHLQQMVIADDPIKYLGENL